MKPDLHPKYRPVVYQDTSSDFAFLTRSTIQTDETIEWEDGNTYPLTGDQFKRADVSYGTQGPIVAFSWKKDGSKGFYRHTSTHIGQYIAIVLDDVVISCPVVQAAISGSGVIQGEFTLSDGQREHSVPRQPPLCQQIL